MNKTCEKSLLQWVIQDATDRPTQWYIYDSDRLNLLNIDNDNNTYIHWSSAGPNIYNELMTNIYNVFS